MLETDSSFHLDITSESEIDFIKWPSSTTASISSLSDRELVTLLLLSSIEQFQILVDTLLNLLTLIMVQGAHRKIFCNGKVHYNEYFSTKICVLVNYTNK